MKPAIHPLTLLYLAAAIGLAGCNGLVITQIGVSAYTVQPGDSLASIAETHAVSMPALIDANVQRYPTLAEPSATNRVRVGWVLSIPPTAGRRSSAPTPSAAEPINSPVNGDWEAQIADEITALTNAERAQAGLAPLTVDAGLVEIARQRAVDITVDYSHAGLEGRCPTCGENINQASGPDSAQRLMAGWMKSPGHRANILRPDVARIGVGVYVLAGRYFAVQIFAY